MSEPTKKKIKFFTNPKCADKATSHNKMKKKNKKRKKSKSPNSKVPKTSHRTARSLRNEVFDKTIQTTNEILSAMALAQASCPLCDLLLLVEIDTLSFSSKNVILDAVDDAETADFITSTFGPHVLCQVCHSLIHTSSPLGRCQRC